MLTATLKSIAGLCLLDYMHYKHMYMKIFGQYVWCIMLEHHSCTIYARLILFIFAKSNANDVGWAGVDWAGLGWSKLGWSGLGARHCSAVVRCFTLAFLFSDFFFLLHIGRLLESYVCCCTGGIIFQDDYYVSFIMSWIFLNGNYFCYLNFTFD